MSRCYNCGTITGENATYKAPIIGYYESKYNSYSEYSYTYYSEECMSDKTNNIGTVKTYNQMRTKDSFVTYDFDSVWTMAGDASYRFPELQCFTLQGSVGIAGNVGYLETVSADLTGVSKTDSTLTYEWYAGGTLVGNDKDYTICANDIGKDLKLKIESTHPMNIGSLTSDAVTVTKAVQTAEPAVPELLSVDDTSFEISTVPNQEYSLDKQNWQATGLFENLERNKEYTVYSRILENDLYLLGESKKVLTVTTDRTTIGGSVAIANAPAFGSKLVAHANITPAQAEIRYEWKRDGATISTNAYYTMTKEDIRKDIILSVIGVGDFKGTLVSDPVTGTKCTVNAPAAPSVVTKTASSITLEGDETLEYSIDRTTWQDSPVFSGLSVASTYTFYQRVKETETAFASPISKATTATTNKNTVSAPENPVVTKVTSNSVVLKKTDGYEYSIDGTNWVQENAFTDLSPNTDYYFYQRIAETPTTYASPKSGYTMAITLKNTVAAPSAPTVLGATDSSVTLVSHSGYEYSLDGETWQTNNTFGNLKVAQTYRFYQRIAETETAYASPAGPAISVTVKRFSETPEKPVLKEVTNKKIVVEEREDCQFSIDGENWTYNNQFINLTPNTTYSIYCRHGETDSNYVSDSSEPLTVTTLKNSVNQPNAPTVAAVTSNSVTLTAVEGYEYSMDAEKWQASNVFEDLLPHAEYTFYQRVAETDTAYASPSSDAVTALTLKNTVAKLGVPVVSERTAYSVTLENIEGYEYSMDAVQWQSSNIFKGLQPNTEYTFYQRVAETDTAYASPVSGVMAVKTLKLSAVKPGTPVVAEVTQTSVRLQSYSAYEYSMDGTHWQKSALFTNLNTQTGYTFRQRVAETDTHYASEPSDAVTVQTLGKPACPNTPEKPVAVKVDYEAVTLLAREGYEYRLSDGDWQSSPVFENLTWMKTYTFCQRIKETAEHKASEETRLTISLDWKLSTSICYEYLQAAIDADGVTQSNGNRKLTITVRTLTYLSFENTPQGIYCNLNSTSTSSGGTLMIEDMGFYLTDSSRYINPTLKINLRSSQGYTANQTYTTGAVDKSTYTKDTKVSVDGADDGSKIYNLFNASLPLMCAYIQLYIAEELDLSFSALGFFDFADDGGRNTYCDKATNNHIGSRVTKYNYPATCTQNGYTGDVCCSNCGEVLTKGTTIACVGSHRFDNACDTQCNLCGFKRLTTHSYDNDCDETCNVCGERRTANHIYDNDCDETCNACGGKRTAPHVFDDAKDLECNLCGFQREPYYYVNFNGNHAGTGTVDPITCYFDKQTSLPKNTYSIIGYTFLGWSTSENGEVVFADGADVVNLTQDIASTVTLYAQWKEDVYAVNYQLDGGTNSLNNPDSYTVNSASVKLESPTRKGYTFLGWYCDASFTDEVKEIPSGSTGDKTFYAKWSFNAPTGKLILKHSARTANAIKVQWNNVKTASGYQVQISTKDGKKWSTYATLKAGVTSFTFKSLAAGTNYKFRVRFYIKAPDGKNYFSPWSATLNSPTLPGGTTLTKLTPAKKAFTAQWKKNATVNGYQVQYSLKANFAGAKTITVKKPKLLKATASKLYAGKYYFVRIRTYKTIAKANYFSAWSKTYKVKTK